MKARRHRGINSPLCPLRFIYCDLFVNVFPVTDCNDTYNQDRFPNFVKNSIIAFSYPESFPALKLPIPGRPGIVS